jgi:Domain of unknown function (DUF4157)
MTSPLSIQKLEARGPSLLTRPKGLLQRRCSCAGNSRSEDCDSCGPRLRRAAASPASPGAVPPAVRQVLGRGGMALDGATRDHFEPRFARDLSHVRVHTDPAAAASARAVNALAYTVGHHLVFDAGQFNSHTAAGRRLLAHELTHAMQQGPMTGDIGALRMGSASDSAEHEADTVARSMEEGALAPRVSAMPPTLARYEPSPGIVTEAPLEEAEPDILAESEGPGTVPIGGAPARHQREAYLRSLSFERMYEKDKRLANYDAAREELERPFATLERGGTAPGFVTTAAKTETQSIAGGAAAGAGNIRVTYTPQSFHLLDAMAYDVGNVTTSEQLIDLQQAYFPESVLNERRTIAGAGGHGATVSLKRLVEFDPQLLDPGGRARTEVFVTAAKAVAAKRGGISLDPVMRALIGEWDAHEKAMEAQRQRRMAAGNQGKPCAVRPVPRKGGDAAHDKFATRVTLSNEDFEITAPDGQTRCVTDGCVPMSRSVWEVKTRHEWATSYGIPGAIFAPYFSGTAPPPGTTGARPDDPGRIMKIEAQRQRCLDVTRLCGYQYSYAFQTQDAVDFINRLWGGNPRAYLRT